MLSVTGRVLSVRPYPDGRFGVCLGPGPDVYWYVADEPPKPGAEVQVMATSATRRDVRLGEQRGSVTELHGARPRTVGQGARVVAPQWLARVRTAVGRHAEDPLDWKLRPYQGEGAAWLATRLALGKGAILGDEPGLGKSVQTVAALGAMGLFPVAVVCPVSLLENWRREFQRCRMRALTFELIRGRRRPLRRADVYILNYQLLRAREGSLAALGLRAIVFDEAQALKEPRPARDHVAAVGSRLALAVRRVVLLTGTPILNRPAEYWRLLHLADPHAFPDYGDYHARYCRAPEADEQASKKRVVTSAGRVERLDELQARVHAVMLRRLKVEVAHDLPPKSRRSVLVELHPDDMADYRLAEQNVIAWLRAQGRLAAPQTRALALMKLTQLRQLAALGKLRQAVPDYLGEWFDRPSPDPLVIFAHHRAVVAGTVNLCVQMGLRVATFGGGDDPKVRQAAVDAFQDARADVFVAPISAAGVGINLHRAADSLFVERLWVPALLVQAEDRLHRIGQERPVTATYLDAAGTVDEHIAATLEAKQRLISVVVDDTAAGEAFRTMFDVVGRYGAEGPS